MISQFLVASNCEFLWWKENLQKQNFTLSVKTTHVVHHAEHNVKTRGKGFNRDIIFALHNSTLLLGVIEWQEEPNFWLAFLKNGFYLATKY